MEMLNLQYKMAVKVTKKVKHVMSLYHKIKLMSRGVHFTWNVSKSAQLLHSAGLLFT